MVWVRLSTGSNRRNRLSLVVAPPLRAAGLAIREVSRADGQMRELVTISCGSPPGLRRHQVSSSDG
jgi:hypothetical protein